jgi:alkylhydroperoxidase family enzyme
MSRIDLPLVSGFSPQMRDQYDRFPSNISRTLLVTENCTLVFLSLGLYLLGSWLDPRHRELVILRVASLSQCDYERTHHLPAARSAGWSDKKISVIELGDEVHLDEDARILLRFVDECVTSVRISGGTFSALHEVLSDSVVSEIIVLVGFFMMTARLLRSLDISLE